MPANIVLTLTGKDRVGIVDELTSLLFKLGGNVETSRMARLGGEFAVIMLVALPAEKAAQLEQGLQSLTAQGYKVTTNQTEAGPATPQAGGRSYTLQVSGADHEGLIHEITHSLSQRGINIESLESGTHPAPITGTPLFSMQGQILVPPEAQAQPWQQDLEETAERLNLEIKLSAVAA